MEKHLHVRPILGRGYQLTVSIAGVHGVRRGGNRGLARHLVAMPGGVLLVGGAAVAAARLGLGDGPWLYAALAALLALTAGAWLVGAQRWLAGAGRARSVSIDEVGVCLTDARGPVAIPRADVARLRFREGRLARALRRSPSDPWLDLELTDGRVVPGILQVRAAGREGLALRLVDLGYAVARGTPEPRAARAERVCAARTPDGRSGSAVLGMGVR